MTQKAAWLRRALERLCTDTDNDGDRKLWKQQLQADGPIEKPDLGWLRQQLPTFLAGPPDAMNCFIAAVLFLRYHYTSEETFAAAKDKDRPPTSLDPEYRHELFKATLDFLRHGLPHRERDPMREKALVYSALVAAGSFVGSEKTNAWLKSAGDQVIRQEMQLRGMRFATLVFDAVTAKRPQLVAEAYHPTLHQFQLVIPNANVDGTKKVRIDEEYHLELKAGDQVIYFVDIADRFLLLRKKPLQTPSVIVTPVATLLALKRVQDRPTAVFPTCSFVR